MAKLQRRRLSVSIGRIFDRRIQAEVVRFILVGVKSNIFYAVLYVGLTMLGVDHRAALTVIYAFGIIYMFLFNKYYVFRAGSGPKRAQFIRHVVVYAGMWALNIAVFQILTVHLHFNPYVAQSLFVAVMVVAVFGLSKYFVFGSRQFAKKDEAAGSTDEATPRDALP